MRGEGRSYGDSCKTTQRNAALRLAEEEGGGEGGV